MDEKKNNCIRRDYTIVTLKWRYEKRIEKFQERIKNRIRQNKAHLD